MAVTLADIRLDVTNEQDASHAIIMVLDTVKAQLAELLTHPTVDPAELQAIHDDLAANTANLAAAAVAGTPAEEPPA